MSKVWRLLSIVLLLITPCLLPNPAWATAEDDFDAGLAAFKEKQYSRAVQHFEQAFLNGMQTSGLYYNLAVSHFKTKSFDNARLWFNKAGQDPRLKDLCEYNLGLLALQQDNHDQAKTYFKKVAATAEQPNLVKLADYQLSGLAEPPQQDRAWSVYAEIESGHDSNVTLATDASPTKKASNYTDMYAHGSVTLAGLAATGLKLSAYALETRYESVPTEDLQLLSLGLEQSLRLGNWQNALGADYLDTTLNGNRFQETIVYEAQTSYLFSAKSYLRLRYRYYDIDSAPPYEELSGNKQRVRLEYRHYSGLDKLRVYYEFEANDRSETRPGSYYSPIRHTLRSAYSYGLGGGFSIKADLSLRESEYHDQAGILVRDETRTIAELGLNWQLTPHWFVNAEYSQTDNRSSNPLYVYKRNIRALSLGMTF